MHWLSELDARQFQWITSFHLWGRYYVRKQSHRVLNQAVKRGALIWSQANMLSVNPHCLWLKQGTHPPCLPVGASIAMGRVTWRAWGEGTALTGWPMDVKAPGNAFSQGAVGSGQLCLYFHYWGELEALAPILERAQLGTGVPSPNRRWRHLQRGGQTLRGLWLTNYHQRNHLIL